MYVLRTTDSTMTDKVETALFDTPLVYIYGIPPLKSNRGHRASEWDVDKPLWQGRLRVIELEHINGQIACELRLEADGELFAVAPYGSNGRGVEAVGDSSRFFAITVVDGSRRAVLGMGFPDRSVSFEFNIALQDFKRHSSVSSVSEDSSPKDYSLKPGQSIHANIGGRNLKLEESVESQESEQTGLPGLLPPPPSRRTRADPFDDDFGDFQ